MPVRQRAARSWVAQPSAGVPTAHAYCKCFAGEIAAREPHRYTTSVAVATPRGTVDRLSAPLAIGTNSRRARTRCRTRHMDQITRHPVCRRAQSGSTDCFLAEGGRSSCAARLASMRFHNEIRVVSGLSAETVIGHDERRARRQQFGDALDRIRRHVDAAESRLGLVWRGVR
jgi:hypothetical protein